MVYECVSLGRSFSVGTAFHVKKYKINAKLLHFVRCPISNNFEFIIILNDAIEFLCARLALLLFSAILLTEI